LHTESAKRANLPFGRTFLLASGERVERRLHGDTTGGGLIDAAHFDSEMRSILLKSISPTE
jgi:hypothetical protein